MSLERARELADAGRFLDALSSLTQAQIEAKSRLRADVLRAELLERTGRHGQAASLIATLVATRHLSPGDRSLCEFVLARIDDESGNVDSALLRAQRAISLASEQTDLSTRVRARIWSLPLIAERSGAEASSPQIVEIRKELTKVGDSRLWATFHVIAAQMDAKRGLSRNARRHLRIALGLLEKSPSAWVSAVLEGVQVGIALLECDVRRAEQHARCAVARAEESGVAASQRTAFGNLGYVLFTAGQFDEALQVINRASSAFPSSGSNHAAILETEAQIELAKGQLDECESLLRSVEETLKNPRDRVTYSYRGGALTMTHLLLRRRRIKEALEQASLTVSLAETARDDFLQKHAVLTRAEIELLSGRSGSAVLRDLNGVTKTLADQPLDVFAHYERVVACAEALDGHLNAAETHRSRASRVYESIGNVPGMLDLSRSWKEASSTQQPAQNARQTETAIAARNSAGLSALQSAAALLLHTGHPDSLAKELTHLLNDLGVASEARAVVGVADDPAQSDLSSSLSDRTVASEHFSLGAIDGQTFEVHYVPKSDIESLATINSIRLLLAAAQEIDRARAERERTLTLWPVEDEPPAEDGFILIGRMGELMAQARRVAKAHITVLITGESGTGKEVLARAVHKYSDRAARPFVPFNCAAVPRDLVESHLFGHRRGAFTGADRDSPGIIRGARGGTIFLDEVGELSLDLQPKLLRFLESGEIAPVGDAAPSIVDVRVVAATNAKLETAVNEGRFREDLFYRLNVVRLDIPPLRERRDEIGALVNHFVAATALEFGKGFVRLAEETMEHLLVHRWPGNVRQLQNEVRRIVALAESDSVIPPDVLAPEILNRHLLAQPTAATGDIAIPVRDKLLPTLSRIEREMIKAALRDHGGRVEAAAKALGISRKGLYLKRQRLGL
jgi:DNA-binding NtrC family response regulator